MALSPRRGKPGPIGGTMPLVEHLRELRTRLVKSVLAIVVGVIIGWILFDHIYDLLSRPYYTGIQPLLEKRGFQSDLTITGVGGAFSFQLKTSFMTGLVLASPVWLWQLWAFVLPALHRAEKRGAVLLTAIGAPLFAAGIFVGYLVLPKGIQVLLNFAPESVRVLLTLGDYLNFVLRTLIVFGIAAEIPLVVILLNRMGVVSFRQLSHARPWIVVGIFVFAAVATPSTDPLTMLFLAVPMTVLYFVAETIARFTDRKREAHEDNGPSDNEISPLDD